jgi:biopolymer transport protein TolR
VFLDNDAVSDAELPAKLEAIAAKKGPDGKPAAIYLRGDTALGYGKVMRVMGELNQAGLNKVSLLTEPSDQR